VNIGVHIVNKYDEPDVALTIQKAWTGSTDPYRPTSVEVALIRMERHINIFDDGTSNIFDLTAPTGASPLRTSTPTPTTAWWKRP
jgi:hypothetical protein